MDASARTAGIESAVRRVRRTLGDAGVSLAGARVLAMCSGGADSVALVALLAGLPRGAAPASVDVLFLDHGLREDTAGERRAAQAAARHAGGRFFERRADTDLAAEPGGLEAAARGWRYDAARATAAEARCGVVATGHTASDQLELALLALVGVTGRAAGLDAMPVERDLEDGLRLVRPLLQLSRAESEEACLAAGLAWCDDPSNADPHAHVRNAVRHRVVPPLLEAHPGAGGALLRAAALARESSDARLSLARALIDAWGVTGSLDVRRLAELQPSARRDLLAAWLVASGLGRAVSSRVVASVERLAVPADAPREASIDLARSTCVRRDGYDLQIQHAPRDGGTRP